MVRAPEIKGETWFNLPREKYFLSKKDLEGKIVLVDFWTYSCINCLRTISHMRKWWEKYREKDLIIVGIHTPEFEFEKDPRNVERAIKDLNVTWPVVLDNDYINWRSFANHYWPAKYLFDRDGRLIYEHFGEGAYYQTEEMIRELLLDYVGEGNIPSTEPVVVPRGQICFRPTQELYCGYLRGLLANEGNFHEDRVFSYLEPDYVPQDMVALSGKFLARPEYVESRDDGSMILLNFRATEVNLVLEAPEGEVEIMVDCQSMDLPPSARGKDLNQFGKLVVKESRLYNLVHSKDPLNGVLRVKAEKNPFRAYAFTFYGCT